MMNKGIVIIITAAKFTIEAFSVPGPNALPPQPCPPFIYEKCEGFLLEIRTQPLSPLLLVNARYSGQLRQQPGRGLLLHFMDRRLLSTYWMLDNDPDAGDTAVTKDVAPTW